MKTMEINFEAENLQITRIEDIMRVNTEVDKWTLINDILAKIDINDVINFYSPETLLHNIDKNLIENFAGNI